MFVAECRTARDVRGEADKALEERGERQLVGAVGVCKLQFVTPDIRVIGGRKFLPAATMRHRRRSFFKNVGEVVGEFLRWCR